jgi:hypothetical protein
VFLRLFWKSWAFGALCWLRVLRQWAQLVSRLGWW